MSMEERPQGEERPPGPDRPLEAYLNGFAALAAAYGAKAVDLAPEAENRPLATHYSAVLQEQIGVLRREVLSAYEEASDDVRGEVELMLEMSAGRTLVAGAMGPVTQVRSLIGFAGLGPIFELVKKLVKWLAEQLGIRIPRFLINLIDLIDELLRAIADIVSPLAGEIVHRSSIRYLESQYHLARLHAVTEKGAVNGDSNGG